MAIGGGVLLAAVSLTALIGRNSSAPGPPPSAPSAPAANPEAGKEETKNAVVPPPPVKVDELPAAPPKIVAQATPRIEKKADVPSSPPPQKEVTAAARITSADYWTQVREEEAVWEKERSGLLKEERGAKRRKVEAPAVPVPRAAVEAPAPGRAAFPEEILEIEGRRIAVAKRLLCWQNREDLAALREHVAVPGMTWERFFDEFGWKAFSGPSGRWLGNDKLVPYIDSSGDKNTLFCVSYDLAPSLINGTKLWGGADCDLLGVRPIDYAGREFALYVQKDDKVYLQSFRLPAEFRTQRQLWTRHAVVESLPEVLAWACRHLPGSRFADLPPRQPGHVPPAYNLRARELLDPRGLSLAVVIGERPLQLALAAAARDPGEQEVLEELLRQRKPAQVQSARDLSPDVLLAYQEQRKPEAEARNLAYIPTIIPYFDITEVLIPNFSLQGRTVQELQERAYREGKLILGVRPLCWDTGDFVLFLQDLRNATILLQPFSLTKDSPRDRERVAYRLRAVVPDVVRALLQPEPPPAAGAADGVRPVPAPRFRR